MGDHARLTLRARRLAIHAGTGRDGSASGSPAASHGFSLGYRSAQYFADHRSPKAAARIGGPLRGQCLVASVLWPVSWGYARCPVSGSAEELKRVDSLRTLAGFRNGAAATPLRPTDPTLARSGRADGVPALHQQPLAWAYAVTKPLECRTRTRLPYPFKLIAGISDDAILGGLHRRAFRHGEIDAVIGLAVWSWRHSR